MQHLPVIFCMDRAGLVGEDGQTHMGLYDIAYMLAVPGMTVTAPKDGDELIGLLRDRAGAHGRPLLHPLPARQGAGRAAARRPRSPPVPYGTWELLREGRDVAILAVGTMVQPSLAGGRAARAPRGIDCAVVNCRFLKPLDRAHARGARCASTACW